MTFQMDASGDESHKSVGGGSRRLPVGRYHVEIMEVDESFQKYADKVPITFEVLGGTIPGQEGTQHIEFYSVNAMDRLKRLAMVVGLLNPGEAKEISFGSAIGSELIIEIEPHSYENKEGKKIETTAMPFGGMYKLDDDEAKGVPRGKSSGGSQPDQSGGDGGTGGGGKWDNL